MTTNDSAIVMKGDLRELKELVELLAGAGIEAEILKPDACRLNT